VAGAAAAGLAIGQAVLYSQADTNENQITTNANTANSNANRLTSACNALGGISGINALPAAAGNPLLTELTAATAAVTALLNAAAGSTCPAATNG